MSGRELRLLTLNVSAPSRERARGLLELLWPAQDDVWVLTETSGGEGTRLIAQVSRAAGHEVLLSDRGAGGGRGVMVVGRGVEVRVEELPGPQVLPGRVLPVRVGAGGREVRVLGVYGAASDPVRYSSAAQRERKREWTRALLAWLHEWRAAAPDLPAVVLGDLNWVDPCHEDPLPHVLPEETSALAALGAEHGLVDAFRRSHPERREVSWVDHSGAGCRYDHAFVTPDLSPLTCDLDQEPRRSRLTDHAALRLVLAQAGRAEAPGRP